MEAVKKIKLLVMAGALTALVSCNHATKPVEESGVSIPEDNHKKELALMASKDSVENEYRNTLNEINTNLASIHQREGSLAEVTNKKGENIFSRKEEILQNISAINRLLEQNRTKIDNLTAKVSSYNRAKKHWKKEIEDMAEVIRQKENDIADLTGQLAQQLSAVQERDNKINELQVSNRESNATSATLDKELHKVYYTLGTYKELKKHNIIEKEGGVLGLGTTETLKPGFEKTYFTEVDMRQATGIVISGKKAKLVTHHPIDSYELKREDEQTAYLTIKDPDKFWGASKYLVVEVK